MTGPFVEHPMNPVSTDASHARMAGLIFKAGKHLVRPAQICTPTYGAGISMRRIVELTPTSFSEELIQELLPVWVEGTSGLHTINSSGHLSAIDLLRRCKPSS